MQADHKTLMVKYLILFALVMGMISCAIPEFPPDPPAGIPDPEFCDLEGNDLLQALEGSWKLYQEPGMLLAGPIPFPLGRQASTPIVLKKIPEKALMDVEAADRSDGLVMFAAVREQEKIAEVALAKNLISDDALRKKKRAGSGCPEKNLPILIGTRDYSGRETFRAEATPFCKDKHEQNKLVQVITRSFDIIGMPTCDYSSPKTIDTELDMKMTLVVRFSSPRYGEGTVIFVGKRDDTVTIHADSKYLREEADVSIPAFAQAPIVLAR